LTIEVSANYLGFPVAPVLDKVSRWSMDLGHSVRVNNSLNCYISRKLERVS
jgi:hypothetical protein